MRDLGFATLEDTTANDPILTWLQHKYNQLFFSNLKSVAANLRHYPLGNAMSFAMLLGMWPLQHCSLTGPFCQRQLTTLLPGSLLHLSLNVADFTDIFDEPD